MSKNENEFNFFLNWKLYFAEKRKIKNLKIIYFSHTLFYVFVYVFVRCLIFHYLNLTYKIVWLEKMAKKKNFVKI